jgi:predicted nucleotidyltransferase
MEIPSSSSVGLAVWLLDAKSHYLAAIRGLISNRGELSAMADIAATLSASDTVLTRFRAALNAAFGDRIERVILYGSRARSDARSDSDYDVAVFLRGFVDRWPEVDRLVVIETDLLDDTGAFVHAMPFREGAWRERLPLMGAIRRDGVDL